MTHYLICYLSFIACWILIVLDSMHTDCRDMDEAVNRGSLVPYTNNYQPTYLISTVNRR